MYASAYVTVFNILLWTLGYGLAAGGSSVKEVARSLVRTPVLYAIVVGLGIYLLLHPTACPDHPAAGTAGRGEHPAVHAHHRYAGRCRDVRSIVTDKHIWKLASVRMLADPGGYTGAIRGAGLPRHLHRW